MVRKKDPLDLAARDVSVATVAFVEAADQLTTAAAVMESIAAQADEEATVQALRAGTARAQAADAKRRAAKLRELVQ